MNKDIMRKTMVRMTSGFLKLVFMATRFLSSKGCLGDVAADQSPAIAHMGFEFS